MKAHLHLICEARHLYGEDVCVQQVPFLLGRHSDCNHQIWHPMVSRRHCEIRQNGDTFLIRDLKSSNGTYVNGRPIRDETPLKEGDEVRLGCVAFRVSFSNHN